MKKEFFTMRMVKHQNRLPTEKWWMAIPGSVQGWATWDLEQPGLEEYVSAHGGKVAVHDF